MDVKQCKIILELLKSNCKLACPQGVEEDFFVREAVYLLKEQLGVNDESVLYNSIGEVIGLWTNWTNDRDLALQAMIDGELNRFRSPVYIYIFN